MSIVDKFDKAVIKAICELFGDSTRVFILRVRDELSKEMPEDKADRLINAFIASCEACFNASHAIGEEEEEEFKKVRKAIIRSLEDLLGDTHVVVTFLAKEIKKEFSKDLLEAIRELNEAIEGEPIERVKANEELEIYLKEDLRILAYTIANIRADSPELVKHEGGLYVFRRRR